MGNDGPDKKDRAAAPKEVAHSYADAIKQMTDGVKDLINQTGSSILTGQSA
jgi:hypothetical protein